MKIIKNKIGPHTNYIVEIESVSDILKPINKIKLRILIQYLKTRKFFSNLFYDILIIGCEVFILFLFGLMEVILLPFPKHYKISPQYQECLNIVNKILDRWFSRETI